ncbi:MAG: hypothetical protein M1834_001705 [Cirrosporium novae-zelandiae]|nr:MAG: hypothetical protein M1834_001705 [Cirrosporium novae-zelandiae]
MATATSESTAADLTKVDSAVAGLSISPPKDSTKGSKKTKAQKEHKEPPKKERKTSTDIGVWNINDLGKLSKSSLDLHDCWLFRHGLMLTCQIEKEGKELLIAKETQKLNWKLNTSPASLDEKDTLKKCLTTPPVKKIDLHFPLGLEVTARNLKGVTIKDALDAIYKQFKKKADDELENPILAGFEWDKEESWTRLVVHQKKEGAPVSSKKSKKNKGGDE